MMEETTPASQAPASQAPAREAHGDTGTLPVSNRLEWYPQRTLSTSEKQSSIRENFCGAVQEVCSKSLQEWRSHCPAVRQIHGTFLGAPNSGHACDMISFLWGNMTVSLTDADQGTFFRDTCLTSGQLAESKETTGDTLSSAAGPAAGARPNNPVDVLMKSSENLRGLALTEARGLLFESLNEGPLRIGKIPVTVWGINFEHVSLVGPLLMSMGQMVKYLGLSVTQMLGRVTRVALRVAHSSTRQDEIAKIRKDLQALKTTAQSHGASVKTRLRKLYDDLRDLLLHEPLMVDEQPTEGDVEMPLGSTTASQKKTGLVYRVIMAPFMALFLLVAVVTNAFTSDGSELSNGFNNTLHQVFAALQAIVSVVLNLIVKAAQHVLHLSKAAVQQLGRWAKAGLLTAKGAIANTASGAWNTVSGFFRGRGGRFLARYRNPLRRLFERTRGFVKEKVGVLHSMAQAAFGPPAETTDASTAAQTESPEPIAVRLTTYAEALVAVVKLKEIRLMLSIHKELPSGTGGRKRTHRYGRQRRHWPV